MSCLQAWLHVRLLSMLLCLSVGITSCAGNSQPAAVVDSQIDSPAESTLSTPAEALLFIEYRNHPNFRISQMDLGTEEFIELFNIPQNGWINQIDLSSDGRQLAFSYTPPPESAQVALYSKAGIYLLLLDEAGLPSQAEPVPLVEPAEGEMFYNPTWSPDGRYIFYIRTTPTENPENSESGVNIMMMRYEMESQTSIEIVADGIWPRVSPNGQRLTYIAADPVTSERALVTTDLAGDDPTVLIPVGDFFDLDSPLFSSDNQWIYFIAAQENPMKVDESSSQALPWWMRLLGIDVASAHNSHNVPADWWRIPAAGGPPEQLTEESQIIIYGAFDYGTDRLYYTTMTGLFVLDGDDVQRLGEARYYRTLAVR